MLFGGEMQLVKMSILGVKSKMNQTWPLSFRVFILKHWFVWSMSSVSTIFGSHSLVIYFVKDASCKFIFCSSFVAPTHIKLSLVLIILTVFRGILSFLTHTLCYLNYLIPSMIFTPQNNAICEFETSQDPKYTLQLKSCEFRCGPIHYLDFVAEICNN